MAIFQWHWRWNWTFIIHVSQDTYLFKLVVLLRRWSWNDNLSVTLWMKFCTFIVQVSKEIGLSHRRQSCLSQQSSNRKMVLKWQCVSVPGEDYLFIVQDSWEIDHIPGDQVLGISIAVLMSWNDHSTVTLEETLHIHCSGAQGDTVSPMRQTLSQWTSTWKMVLKRPFVSDPEKHCVHSLFRYCGRQGPLHW